jgi:hypothetical protein
MRASLDAAIAAAHCAAHQQQLTSRPVPYTTLETQDIPAPPVVTALATQSLPAGRHVLLLLPAVPPALAHHSVVQRGMLLSHSALLMLAAQLLLLTRGPGADAVLTLPYQPAARMRFQQQGV